MFEKFLFFFVVFCFPFYLYKSIRTKSYSKIMTAMAITVLAAFIILTYWPIYLNNHLAFGFLGLSYSVGMFIEGFKEKKPFLRLTGIVLLLLGGLQIVEYLKLLQK